MSDVKCGHCGSRHATIARVQLCARRDWARRERERWEEAEARAEYEAEQGYERWLEDGGAHSEVIAWENEQDRLRAPFDPQR